MEASGLGLLGAYQNYPAKETARNYHMDVHDATEMGCVAFDSEGGRGQANTIGGCTGLVGRSTDAPQALHGGYKARSRKSTRSKLLLAIDKKNPIFFKILYPKL